ncbi:Vam6/Vps39-like protein [Smittium mucronatum]|uniref:Vam6/Vps39-like protein n=1 Tax=Smittium mucronatum TaxID=133383 RepID=A0A1R0GYA3_9FUNG|nr:Vam6/Vps39-like protein [Smittium mucronatum]
MVRAAFKAIPVIELLPVQISCICGYGSKLIIGSSTGTLLVYRVKNDGDDSLTLTLEDTKKDLSKKSIDSVVVIKETGLLACLSDDFVSLYDLNTFTKSMTLNSTKGATIMTAITSIELISGIPTIISKLAVVVKKKIIIFEWRDSEYFESKEYSSGDKIETIRFSTINFMFVATFKDFWTLQLSLGQWDELFSADTSSLLTVGAGFDASIAEPKYPDIGPRNSNENKQEVSQQSSTSWSGWGLGFGGALINAGYGSNFRKYPIIKRMPNDELLLCRENTGVFVTSFGKISKRRNDAGYRALIRFSHSPIDLTFTSTYVISISGTPSKRSLIKSNNASLESINLSKERNSKKLDQSYCVEIRNILTGSLIQQVELLCTIPENDILNSSQEDDIESHVVSTDSPKHLAKQIDGKQVWVAGSHTLWRLTPYPISSQVEEQILLKNYIEAESLIAQSDMILESEREELSLKVKYLHSIYLLSFPEKCEIGFNMLLDLNANPEEIISKFPKSISGNSYREYTPNSIKNSLNSVSSIFDLESSFSSSVNTSTSSSSSKSEDSPNDSNTDSLQLNETREHENISLPESSTIGKDGQTSRECFIRILQGLMRYLVDHRRKIQSASDKMVSDLQYLSRVFSQRSPNSFSSEINAPRDSSNILNFDLIVEPVPVEIMATVVDTTLLKVYLEIAPSLVGSLVRVNNSCEIKETEKILLDLERYKDLVDFYYCKGLHRKALDLLFSRGSDSSEVVLKGISPTVYYLQKLPSSQLDLILEYFSWPLKLSIDIENGINNPLYNDPDLEVFSPTSLIDILFIDDRPIAKEFNRELIGTFLSFFSLKLATYYLKFVLKSWNDTDVTIHDQLATYMIQDIINDKDSSEITENSSSNSYSVDSRTKPVPKNSDLLQFLRTSKIYTASKVLAVLPTDFLFLERSTVLGRLGRYKQGLSLLVQNNSSSSSYEDFCLDNLHNHPGIFIDLIDILVSSLPKENDQSVINLITHGEKFNLIMMLMRKYSSNIPATSLIPILPDYFPLNDSLGSYLKAQITSNSMKIGKGKVEISLSNHELNRLGDLLYDCKDNYVKLDKTKVCFVCHKKLNFDSSFVALPYHYYDSLIKNRKLEPKDSSNTNTSNTSELISSAAYANVKYFSAIKSKQQIEDQVSNLGLEINEKSYSVITSLNYHIQPERVIYNQHDDACISHSDGENAEKAIISTHSQDGDLDTSVKFLEVDCRIKIPKPKVVDSHPMYNRYIREYQLKTLGSLTSNIKLLHYSCWRRISDI